MGVRANSWRTCSHCTLAYLAQDSGTTTGQQGRWVMPVGRMTGSWVGGVRWAVLLLWVGCAASWVGAIGRLIARTAGHDSIGSRCPRPLFILGHHPGSARRALPAPARSGSLRLAVLRCFHLPPIPSTPPQLRERRRAHRFLPCCGIARATHADARRGALLLVEIVCFRPPPQVECCSLFPPPAGCLYASSPVLCKPAADVASPSDDGADPPLLSAF